MRNGGLEPPLGGDGKIVEADETYYGSVETPCPRNKYLPPVTKKGRSGPANKRPIVATDESRLYFNAADLFAAHETVHHTSGQYVRYADGRAIHTNSAEGFFSIFRRGMRGIYQHCKEKHLHRYLAEYDLRYNHRTKLGYNDGERAALAVKSATGKRLTYRQAN